MGAEGVEAVLQDIMVNSRERDGAELVAELVNAMELIGVVGRGAFAQEDSRLVQGPAVEEVELRVGDSIPSELVIEEVGKLVAKGVAEEPIRLGDILQNRPGCRRGNLERLSRGESHQLRGLRCRRRSSGVFGRCCFWRFFDGLYQR